MAEVIAGGVRFHVQRLGGGDRTVVFLHGLVMHNLSSWYFTVWQIQWRVLRTSSCTTCAATA